METEAPRDWDGQQIKRGASFLQSAPWAEFQNSLGWRPHFLADKAWSCLLFERRTRIGGYLLAPYGPTLDSPAALPQAIKKLSALGRRQGAVWLRLEPVTPGGQSNGLRTKLGSLGARPAPHNVEPALTRVLDLRPAAEALLAGISPTTRSYIRKNDREHAVGFKTSADPADVPVFAAMVREVSSRTKAGFFSREYYQKQAEILMPAGRLFLELALLAGRPVGGIMMHDFGPVSSYTYAASLPAARQQNVSALLLWQAMLNAKSRGIQKLDLFGVAPEDAPPSHPWSGFSAFKRKFGGEVIEHAGTWDVPLVANKYRLYRSAKAASDILRRR